MKKLIVVVLVFMVAAAAEAQLPLQHCGDSGYLYPCDCSTEIWFRISGTCADPLGGFFGSGYIAHRDTVVYGVSVPVSNLADFPYVWVYLMKARVVDSAFFPPPDSLTLPLYDLDVERRELYCFVDRPPVAHSRMDFVSTRFDTNVVTMPMYEFYFEPCGIDSGDIYYVGVMQSVYNVYNHFNKNAPDYYCPRSFFITVEGTGNAIDVQPDSVKSLSLSGFPRWNNPYNNSTPPYILNDVRLVYSFLPIVRPPQGEEENPPHREPVAPGAVTGLRLDSVAGARAWIGWDAAPASEWGPTGVNVRRYQLSYAEYGTEYAEGDTVDTEEPRAEIPEEMDTMKYYKARCRAQSLHQCEIHDTVVWGPWSEDFAFYTGTHYPDTVPLECGAVEGFRHAGERGGMPSFEWSRGVGQTVFEIAYAAGRAAWSGEATDRTMWSLPPTTEPGTEYRVRVRAKCMHRCYIHDTVMWGPWSRVLRVTTPGERAGVAETVASGGRLFSLEPNPARGRVALRIGDGVVLPGEVTVTDMQGREVLRRAVEAGAAGAVLETAGLPSGTYMVTLTCRDGRADRRRLLIE